MVTFVPKFVNQACADWHRGAVAAAAAEGIAEADNARFSPSTPPTARPIPSPSPTWPTWWRTASTCARSPGSTTSGSAATTTASRCCPTGLEDVTGYPALLAALADRGWSADDLARLTCRNVLRVMRDVEAGAREIQRHRRARAWPGSRTSTTPRGEADHSRKGLGGCRWQLSPLLG